MSLKPPLLSRLIAPLLVLGMLLTIRLAKAQQLPQPSDFVLPDNIAIVWPNLQAIEGPIGLPPGGNVLLMAKATAKQTGAALTGFVWHRSEDPTFSYAGQYLSVTQPGSYTVQADCYTDATDPPVQICDLVSLRVIVVSTDDANGNILSYARVTSVQKAGMLTPAQVAPLTIGDKQQQTSYLDGLGRGVQSVQTAVTPNGQDLLTFEAYDEAGGTPQSYLPYARPTSSTPYQPLATLLSEQAQFYQATPAVAVEPVPYAQSTSEASPLYRPLQASRVGTLAAQHPTTVAYEANFFSDVIRQWTITQSNAANPGSPATLTSLVSPQYSPWGILAKTVTKDADGRTTILFQNELGQTVLQRKVDATSGSTAQLDTYTLYDDLGHVSCVIPPAAVAALASANPSNSTSSAAFIQRWLYTYTYDERGRLTSRQVPGVAPVYFIYDQSDRPILTQDGNQRTTNDWYFTKYDLQGRAIMEGLFHDSRSWRDLQDAANNWTTGAGGEQRLAVDGGGYTSDQTFPALSSADRYLSFNFYDDYSLYDDGSQTYFYQSQPELDAQTQPKPDYNALGRLTVSRKRIVNSDNSLGEWVTTVALYDQYGNVIQKQSNNILNGGLAFDEVPNKTTLVYGEGGFRPRLERSITHQQTDLFDDLVVYNRFAYDPAGRLLNVWQQHQRGSLLDPEVLVANYAYNALGQLKEKNLHSQDGGLSFLQSVDLRYNSNGQLTSFNNSALGMDNGVTNDDTNDVFGFTLVREQQLGTWAVTPRFDGGLSGIRWQVANTLQQNQPQRERAYAFTYDGWGRMTDAYYAARPLTSATFNKEKDAYSENQISYDANGNLLKLSRRTQASDASAAFSADKLRYTYDGNRLLAVEDGSDPLHGFRDNAHTTTEYSYDANGSVLNDANKQVGYTYNLLNKVAVQTVGTSQIQHDYDATGTLLHRKVTKAGIASDYYYLDGVEYEVSARLNGLAGVPTPEGRAVTVVGTAPALTTTNDGTTLAPAPTAQPLPSEGGPPSRFVYEYHLRDHLNNLRVAFRAETSQRQLRLTMESAANEEGAYPRFQNVTATRSTLTAEQGSASAAVTATQPGPSATLPVADGDAVKIDFFYRTPAGVQYYRSSSSGTVASAAAKLGPTLALLPALAPAAHPSEHGQAAPRWQAGVQLGLTGLLSRWLGGRAARQQRQLATAIDTGPGVMNSTGGGGREDFPAYVQWKLFAADGTTLLQQGLVEVPVVVEQLQQPQWSHFSTTIAVDAAQPQSRTGQLRIQVINEGSQAVYVDSLTIRHPQPALFISQENHYYPFGMNLSGVAVNTLPTDGICKQQNNGGSTLEDELLSAESGNYATPYRQYDPSLGRFLGVDPLADSYASQTPYQFGNNDPANANDPTGAWATQDSWGNMGLTGGRGQDSFGFAYQSRDIDPTGGGGGNGSGSGLGVSPTPGLGAGTEQEAQFNPWASTSIIGRGESEMDMRWGLKQLNTLYNKLSSFRPITQVYIWDASEEKNSHGHVAIRVNDRIFGFYPEEISKASESFEYFYTDGEMHNQAFNLNQAPFSSGDRGNVYTLNISDSQEAALLYQLINYVINPVKYSVCGNSCATIAVDAIHQAGITMHFGGEANVFSDFIPPRPADVGYSLLFLNPGLVSESHSFEIR